MIQGYQLELTLQMIADELTDRLQLHHFTKSSKESERNQTFTNVKIYDISMGRKQLKKNVLYLVTKNYVNDFPEDSFSYICNFEFPGKAGHIDKLSCSDRDMLNLLLDIFQKYREIESRLISLVASGCSLDDLCLEGREIMGNPMYTHDRHFIITSMPIRVKGMLEYKYDENTETYSTPLDLIADFKDSSEYQKTLRQKHACIWGKEQYPYGMRSMYVNLRDKDVYLGRLLINELESPFKLGQLTIAEFIGKMAETIIRTNQLSKNQNYRSAEETMRQFIQGKAPSSQESDVLFTSLSWKKEDTYLCLCTQSFEERVDEALELSFQNTLMDVFKRSISYFQNQRLYLFMNLTQNCMTPREVRHLIAPFLRDNLMYGGLSNPVTSFRELPYAAREAEITLTYVSTWQDDRWILDFEACALYYIFDNIKSELPYRYLATGSLSLLKKHDQEKGTDYYHTLQTYLSNDCSISKTSDALVLHRTTLTYRLSKIQELLNVRLDTADRRLYYRISYWLLDHMED